MRTRFVHKKCGATVGFYFGSIKAGTEISAAMYQRVDGTHPEAGSSILERCPSCGEFFDLRPSQIDRVEEAETRCPECGSSEVVVLYSGRLDSDRFEYQCGNCNHEWDEEGDIGGA